jgi:hypothetical protein
MPKFAEIASERACLQGFAETWFQYKPFAGPRNKNGGKPGSRRKPGSNPAGRVLVGPAGYRLQGDGRF